jgi:putative membrane-bound dehydrogenase-like protein
VGALGALLLFAFMAHPAGPLLADDFPRLYNSEPGAATLLAPEQALKKIVAPKGFRTTLFAHEPDVQNPIAMAFDGRGRLWVAENYTYAERGVRFDLTLRDRVIILADEDGDGQAESRRVFSDDLQMLTGLVVVPDGVWLMCPPRLLFVPDRNGDDQPDGPPQEVLDGFTVAQENYHNFANGLKIGPDGWLYGRCGASCPGEVGPPGATPEERVPLRGGLWRYHRERAIFEPLTQGTTNPWGHDWNAVGEPFFINTVNGHLWHAIPGAHFVRPHSLDANPRAYELIDQHADHWHFDTGKSWTDSRGGAANSYGGGHAHIGCTIYQGDGWPEEYRGKLLTLNMHGRRINVEALEREGSGYVGRHRPDMVLFGDPWFRGIDLDYGPDGNVWVLDWSDTGECHESNGVHRTSGRIYKLSYGAPRPMATKNVDKADPLELARLHEHPSQWYVRHARMALKAQHDSGIDCREAIAWLRTRLKAGSVSSQRLDALWTLHVLGGISADDLKGVALDGDEYLRVAAIRLLSEFWPLDTCRGDRPPRISPRGDESPDEALLSEFCETARTDSSAAVRLALASTLQRLPVDQRARLAIDLQAHEEDRTDHNIPLMVWYGLIPVGEQDPAALADVFSAASSPTLRRLIARRLGEAIESSPQPLERLLETAQGDAADDLLDGLSVALAGWHKPPEPAGWAAFAARFDRGHSENAHKLVRQLSALFGDGRSLDELKRIASDKNEAVSIRVAALQSLVDIGAPDIRQLCAQLLGTRYLNTVAVQGLARDGAAEVADKIVAAYRSFAPLERPAVIATLCTRPAWGLALLKAIENKRIPKEDLNANHARQLSAFNDAEIDRQLGRVWGRLRETPAERRELIGQLKEQLASDKMRGADAAAGREVFKKVCGNCHRLYGEGGKIGPDLTGAQRQNLTYLLENIIDPSAVVTADFGMSTILMNDGRVLAGIIIERTPQRIVLQTQNERLTLSSDEVETVKASATSLMPDGLLQTLSPAEVKSLFAYLMTRTRLE